MSKDGARIGNRNEIMDISCGPGTSASLCLVNFLQKKKSIRILKELFPDGVNTM